MGRGGGAGGYGDARARALEQATPQYPIVDEDIDRFVAYSRFVPAKTSKARADADTVLDAMDWKYEQRPAARQKAYEPAASIDDVITSQTKAKEDSTAAWVKARTERAPEEDSARTERTTIPKHPTQEGSVEETLHAVARDGRELVKRATLNRSQRHGAALQVDAMLRNYAGDLDASIVLIQIGPGGAGKTHGQNKVVRPLAVKLRGPSGERGLCQANAAARVLGQGAMTCHAFIHQLMGEKLSRGRTKKQEQAEKEAGNLLSLSVDEFGMLSFALFDAVEEYCALGCGTAAAAGRGASAKAPQPLFGGIAAVALLGDFYQLPPVLAQGAAQMHTQDAANFETAQGWAKYKRIENAIVLRECKRFESEVLERLTNRWRAGQKSTDEDWEKFEESMEGAAKYMDASGNDTRFSDPGFLGATFVSDTWQVRTRERTRKSVCESGLPCGRRAGGAPSLPTPGRACPEVVARSAQLRARRDAARLGEMLVYVQAVDTRAGGLFRHEAWRLLQAPAPAAPRQQAGAAGGGRGRGSGRDVCKRARAGSRGEFGGTKHDPLRPPARPPRAAQAAVRALHQEDLPGARARAGDRRRRRRLLV
jgi:hypothetical protein